MRLIPSLLALLFLAGCSGDTSEQQEQQSPKEHIMRSQIDAMNRAKELKPELQQRLDEQQRAAEEIAR